MNTNCYRLQKKKKKKIKYCQAVNEEDKDLSAFAEDIILPFLDINLGEILLYTYKDADCIIIMPPDTYGYICILGAASGKTSGIVRKSLVFSLYRAWLSSL